MPAQEDDRGMHLAGDGLGQLKSDPAQTTSEQVDTVFAKTGLRRWIQMPERKAWHPALVAAIRNFAVLKASCQFYDQRIQETHCVVIQVEATCLKAWILLSNNFACANQRGLLGIELLLAGDGIEVVGEHGQCDGIDRLNSHQCSGQREQAIEAAPLLLLEAEPVLRGARCRGHTPGMNDLRRQQAVMFQILKEAAIAFVIGDWKGIMLLIVFLIRPSNMNTNDRP